MFNVNVRSANFQDLLQTHYVGRVALPVANSLKSLRTGDIPEYEFESFPLGHHISQSSAILFSPVISLLRFYSLLEIALIGKFIPEPDYADPFWKETAENLNQLLASSPADPGHYPMVLPRFLFGRLTGRMHLQEEGIDVRYDELASILVSFFSVARRWRDPDIGMFLRFVLSSRTTEKSSARFINVVADKNEFIRRIIVARSAPTDFTDRLLCGFSEMLNLCEDLDRLLEATKAFPLLQSAMWVYHAGLFSARDRRLQHYLIAVIEAFFPWLNEQPELDEASGKEICAERAIAINSYYRGAKEFMERLSSGEYGVTLSSTVFEPVVQGV